MVVVIVQIVENGRMSPFSVKIERGHAHFCSGHFLVFADGTAEPLHGHNYQVEIEVSGRLGNAGLVVDFLALMPIVKAVCGELDGHTLLPTRNRYLKVRRTNSRIEAVIGRKAYAFPASDVVLLPIANSSCELLAEYVAGAIMERLCRMNGVGRLEILRVSIEEAPGQVGTFTGPFTARRQTLVQRPHPRRRPRTGAVKS